METKKCTKCKINKPIDQYYFDKNPGRYKTWCKNCHNGIVLKSRRQNQRKCNIPECNAPHYGLGYCRMHHARYKRNGLKNIDKGFKGLDISHPRNLRKYGITEEEFKEWSKNGCQICGVKIAAFTLDHDHNCCNEVPYCGECTRGYVCHACNISISKYEQNIMRDDNPVKQGVIRYLVNHDIRRKQLQNIKTLHDVFVDPQGKYKEW